MGLAATTATQKEQPQGHHTQQLVAAPTARAHARAAPGLLIVHIRHPDGQRLPAALALAITHPNNEGALRNLCCHTCDLAGLRQRQALRQRPQLQALDHRAAGPEDLKLRAIGLAHRGVI